jgi:hypothetical protein
LLPGINSALEKSVLAGQNGGARPGAGRKSKSTVTYQAKMRAIVEQTVTSDIWQAVVLTATEQAKKGDDRARQWLTPWVLGAPPKAPEEGADTSMVAKGDL